MKEYLLRISVSGLEIPTLRSVVVQLRNLVPPEDRHSRSSEVKRTRYFTAVGVNKEKITCTPEGRPSHGTLPEGHATRPEGHVTRPEGPFTRFFVT